MKEMIISIKGLNDVCNFVTNTQKVNGDITIQRGRYAVDGKSVLGIFSFDMSQDVTVTYPSEAIDFENFIEQFKVNR